MDISPRVASPSSISFVTISDAVITATSFIVDFAATSLLIVIFNLHFG